MHVEPRVLRRLVAFEVQRHAELGARVLDRGDQVQESPRAPRRAAGTRRGGRRAAPRRSPFARGRLPPSGLDCCSGRKRDVDRAPCRNGWRAGCGSGSSPRAANGSAGTTCGNVERRKIGERRQRQAKPERRIAGQQEQPAGARRPRLADPAPRITRRLCVPPLHREHVARGLAQARARRRARAASGPSDRRDDSSPGRDSRAASAPG